MLADGRAVRLGARTRKSVAGYDLVGLMCGSEGTLGIVTEATVRLRPPPAEAATLAASFPTLRGAGDAIARIAREQRPSLLELMDQQTIRAVEAFQPQDLDPDAAAMVFARADDGRAESLAAVAAMERICEACGADLVVTSDEEAEGRMLMAARRLAFTALERRGATLLDDVGVPLGAIPALLDGCARIADELGVLICTFGHAGDGNMHPTVVYDAGDADEVERARGAFEAILALALTLGGTITGEHGVGLLKRPYLSGELGDAHDLHRAIKAALDPAGVFNPGKADLNFETAALKGVGPGGAVERRDSGGMRADLDVVRLGCKTSKISPHARQYRRFAPYRVKTSKLCPHPRLFRRFAPPARGPSFNAAVDVRRRRLTTRYVAAALPPGAGDDFGASFRRWCQSASASTIASDPRLHQSCARTSSTSAMARITATIPTMLAYVSHGKNHILSVSFSGASRSSVRRIFSCAQAIST